MGTADYAMFGPSPSLEDHRAIHKIYSTPHLVEPIERDTDNDNDNGHIEYDIENDPNLTI